MPIGKMPTPSSTAASTAGAAGRTVFRPPWVKGEEGKEVKPATWRRPSTTTTTPATPNTETKLETKKDDPPKRTVKTQNSTNKEPTENGKPAAQTKEVSAKLQSREIKVPVMTEPKKTEPAPIKKNLKPVETKEKDKPAAVEPEPAKKVNLRPVEAKEKDEKKKPEEKRVFDKPKSLLKKVESPATKMPLKKDLSREGSTDLGSKFIRPVLRKTPKVEDSYKEIEKSKLPTVELKRTEQNKKEVERAKMIEVSLSRTVINKKEPEKPKSSKKLEPVKTPCEYNINNSIKYFQ